MIFRKSLLLALVVSLAPVGARPVLCAPQDAKEIRRIAKLKSDVARRGIGEDARVKVKLRDKREIKGYISRAGEEDFMLIEEKTSMRTPIAYRDVAHIKGKGLSTFAKIGIGVGIFVVVVGVVIFAASKSLDSIGN